MSQPSIVIAEAGFHHNCAMASNRPLLCGYALAPGAARADGVRQERSFLSDLIYELEHNSRTDSHQAAMVPLPLRRRQGLL